MNKIESLVLQYYSKNIWTTFIFNEFSITLHIYICRNLFTANYEKPSPRQLPPLDTAYTITRNERKPKKQKRRKKNRRHKERQGDPESELGNNLTHSKPHPVPDYTDRGDSERIDSETNVIANPSENIAGFAATENNRDLNITSAQEPIKYAEMCHPTEDFMVSLPDKRY